MLVAAMALVPSAVVAANGDGVPEGLTASDWSSIRSSIEANRHAALAVEDGYQARNPSQQWRTHFDGRGFVTTPEAGGWSWGLELVSYGRHGAKRTFEAPACVEADGKRVAYEWSDALTEWYISDGRGLEHGYTVHQRPEGGAGPLQLTLAVRGELRPQVSGTGRDVRFANARGATVLNYSGLTVFDADGVKLPAWFEPTGEGLRLTVEDGDARYPLTIDPLAQQAYLKASNTTSQDRFGQAVAVSGDTVVIGAWNEGVSPNTGAGAAYVFVRSGTTWQQQAFLKASNTNGNDQFAISVAISGDTVVVGAHFEDSAATGVDGDQNNGDASNSGAAYVFVRSGATWSQQAYIKASNTGADDGFGIAVALFGDTLVVGAHQEDSNATGVDGDQNNGDASNAGAAYVFVRSGASWSQQAYLKASNTGASDNFGDALSVSGDTLVIGADLEDSNATGVDGDGANNSVTQSGAAYVFVRSGATWSQQAYLKASNTGGSDNFGEAVAVSGDTLVVGAAGEDSNATGVNGDEANSGASGAGAAYVFVRSGMTWSQQAYLKASNTDGGDVFGSSVAVSGDTVVVGAYAENGGATGVNGDDTDDSFADSGAAYVFIRDAAGLWMQQAYLKASNTGASDHFGSSVALSGYIVVVGADLEDSDATGVDGDQADNSQGNAGAAYAFVLPPDCDGDGDVDLDDYADYATCHDGPGAGLGLGCECRDWNVDGDVDLRDFAPIQNAIGQ